MPTRTESGRRTTRYAEQPVQPAAAEVRRDSAGDVIDEDDGGPAELRDEAEQGDVAADGDGSQDEDEANEEEDLPGPQPLTSDALPFIRQASNGHKGTTGDLQRMRECVADTAILRAEVKEGVDETGTELDTAFRDSLELYEESSIRRSVLEDIHQKISHGHEIIDAVTMYKEAVAAALDKHAKKTTRQKFAQQPEYVALKEQIWEAYNQSAMPPMVDQIPAEQGDGDDDDEDFAVGGTLMDFRCPITMAIIDVPVTNNACKHSYSKAAIQEYVAERSRKRERANCPKAGCDKVVTSSSLYDDTALAKRIAGYKRRLESRQESRRGQTTLID